MPAALLARHRLDLRTSDGAPSTLSELMLRYERFDCTEPSDHAYALFNLIASYLYNLTQRCQSQSGPGRQIDSYPWI